MTFKIFFIVFLILLLTFMSGCNNHYEIKDNKIINKVLENTTDLKHEFNESANKTEEITKKIPLKFNITEEYIEVCDKFLISKKDYKSIYTSWAFNLQDTCKELNKITDITGLESTYKFYIIGFSEAAKTYSLPEARIFFSYYIDGGIYLQGKLETSYDDVRIIHGITDSYIEDLYLPRWLEAGIAQYVADTIKNKRILYPQDELYCISAWAYEKEKLNNLAFSLDEKIQWDNLAYETSEYLVKKIIDYYGEESLKYLLNEFKKMGFNNYGEDYNKTKQIIKKLEGKYGELDSKIKKYILHKDRDCQTIEMKGRNIYHQEIFKTYPFSYQKYPDTVIKY